MNAEQIARLKELAQAATPGPWTNAGVAIYGEAKQEWDSIAVTHFPGMLGSVPKGQRTHNAAFIAAANPAAVLELIADLEIAKTAIEAHQNAAKSRQNRIAELEALLAERTTLPVSQMTDATIREIFMAHGFTIKEGQTDLKQYVYEAAHALMDAMMDAAPAIQQPQGERAAFQAALVRIRDLGEIQMCECDQMVEIARAALAKAGGVAQKPNANCSGG